MINGKSEDEYNSFRYYCKWVGSTYCNNEYKSFYIKGNKDFIGLLQNELSADNMVRFNNEVRVSYKKKKIWYYRIFVDSLLLICESMC